MSLDFENDNEPEPMEFPWLPLLIIIVVLATAFFMLAQNREFKRQDDADAATRMEIWCSQHPGYFCNRKGK